MTKDKALFILGEMPEWNPDCRYSREEYEEIIELFRVLLLASDKEEETDLISREAVIDLLNQFGYYNKEMERYLSAIPSTAPERSKGHWIPVYGKNGKTIMSYKCSECQFHPKRAIITDFCGGCGSDMRGGRINESSN